MSSGNTVAQRKFVTSLMQQCGKKKKQQNFYTWKKKKGKKKDELLNVTTQLSKVTKSKRKE